MPAELINLYQQVPAEVWSLIVETVFVALITSPLLLGFKRWWHIHSEKVMLSLAFVGAMVGPLAFYLIGTPQFQPVFVAVQGLVVFAVMQPWYVFGVKPLVAKLALWFNSKLAEAAADDAELKSAAVPATGLPVVETPVQPRVINGDF